MWFKIINKYHKSCTEETYISVHTILLYFKDCALIIIFCPYYASVILSIVGVAWHRGIMPAYKGNKYLYLQ